MFKLVAFFALLACAMCAPAPEPAAAPAPAPKASAPILAYDPAPQGLSLVYQQPIYRNVLTYDALGNPYIPKYYVVV